MATFNRPLRTPATPDDFGLGLVVSILIAGGLLFIWAAAASLPSEGPQGQSRPPERGTYTEQQPASVPPVLPTP